MVAAVSLRTLDARIARPEQRIALERVPWKTYVLLKAPRKRKRTHRR